MMPMERGKYGVLESNPITKEQRQFNEDAAEVTVDWTDPRLARIVRLRLVSDIGFPAWDVSYCVGELQDGTPCHVTLPFNQLDRGKGARSVMQQITEYGRQDKVFVKRILSPYVISRLV